MRLAALIVLSVSMMSLNEVSAGETPAGAPSTPEQIRELNLKPQPTGEALYKAVFDAVKADTAKRHLCSPKSIGLHELHPMTFDKVVGDLVSRGEIENGWVVSADLVGCASADPIRVLVVRSRDGKSLSGFFSGQGETLTWPSLIHDMGVAMGANAYAALKASAPECEPTEFNPIGGIVTSRGADLGPDVFGVRFQGSWTETWAYTACGHRIDVPVALKADGQGGAYWTISTDKVQFTR